MRNLSSNWEGERNRFVINMSLWMSRPLCWLLQSLSLSLSRCCWERHTQNRDRVGLVGCLPASSPAGTHSLSLYIYMRCSPEPIDIRNTRLLLQNNSRLSLNNIYYIYIHRNIKAHVHVLSGANRALYLYI